MRKLITAALLTASFSATAEDRVAYVIHYQNPKGLTSKVATFNVQSYGKGSSGVVWADDMNRQLCQGTMDLWNELVAEAHPDDPASPWWCEPE